MATSRRRFSFESSTLLFGRGRLSGIARERCYQHSIRQRLIASRSLTPGDAVQVERKGSELAFYRDKRRNATGVT